jgi:hypothetical protein
MTLLSLGHPTILLAGPVNCLEKEKLTLLKLLGSSRPLVLGSDPIQGMDNYKNF